MMVREAGREARAGITEERISKGRAGVAVEAGKPFAEHAAGEVPLIGEWLSGKLYGTARNAAPDAPGDRGHGRGRKRPGG